MKKSLVIVGASYAGIQLAAAARERGFEGSITLLGEESEAPYQRPFLSKGYLTSEQGQPPLALRSEAFFVEERIDWIPSSKVELIDRSSRTVSLQNGKCIAYDYLALTTGARVRTIECPGATLEGVFYLRSVSDARKLREATGEARRIVIIGGGYIGLEVAASLKKRGLDVTVVETQARVLARVASPLLSDFVYQTHLENGVRFEFGRGVVSLRNHLDSVDAVELSDGTLLECDVVVVGIGVIPNVELARQCGLEVDGGILVDAFARTSDPLIVAAGDCAAFDCHWMAEGSAPCRIESVQNANDMAKVAASTLTGSLEPHKALPWFWSDQYDLKLQIAGLHNGSTDHVLVGSVEDRKFSIYYFRDGSLTAVDSINSPQDHMLARRLLTNGLAPTFQQVQEENFALKTFAAARVTQEQTS